MVAFMAATREAQKAGIAHAKASEPHEGGRTVEAGRLPREG